MTLSKRKEKLIGRLRSRRMRPREGLVLVEGLNTVEEALESGVEARFALAARSLERFERGRRIMERLEVARVSVEWVGEDVITRLSDTETPQGVLLVCREPVHTVDALPAEEAGRLLILDAVQDPGNLGTLVRAARAFRLGGVVTLDGTVDPWNPKAVRAAAGSSFKIPVVRASWEAVVPILVERRMQLLVAEAGGRDVGSVTVAAPWALVVGNEGDGPRSQVLDSAAVRVGVPMPGGTESLNAGVAGAILLYALTASSAS